tara:strand:+ start:1423 stop:1632 length:210 start_codon:yes stop_codon:yes gene_type:complete
MDHAKSKMKVKKMPGGGMMKDKMMKHGGKHKMPMYMYGGKVFGEKGAMLRAILKDPAQAAMAKKELGMK